MWHPLSTSVLLGHLPLADLLQGHQNLITILYPFELLTGVDLARAVSRLGQSYASQDLEAHTGWHASSDSVVSCQYDNTDLYCTAALEARRSARVRLPVTVKLSTAHSWPPRSGSTNSAKCVPQWSLSHAGRG